MRRPPLATGKWAAAPFMTTSTAVTACSAPSRRPPFPSATSQVLLRRHLYPTPSFFFVSSLSCRFRSFSRGHSPCTPFEAANTAFYADAKACGRCFEVKCTSSDYLANACYGNTVIVEVTDQCPCSGNERYSSLGRLERYVGELTREMCSFALVGAAATKCTLT